MSVIPNPNRQAQACPKCHKTFNCRQSLLRSHIRSCQENINDFSHQPRPPPASNSQMPQAGSRTSFPSSLSSSSSVPQRTTTDIMKRPIRERLIHLLAVRPYKKLEILPRMNKGYYQHIAVTSKIVNKYSFNYRRAEGKGQEEYHQLTT